MKKNKKAWLRIVEAVIAVLIVASVLLIVLSRQSPKQDKSEEIYEKQRAILNQISQNITLRGYVIDANEENDDEIEEFVKKNAPVGWEFRLKICDVEKVCALGEYIEKNIYSQEIIISSTLEEYNPKKLKLFVWEK